MFRASSLRGLRVYLRMRVDFGTFDRQSLLKMLIDVNEFKVD